MKTPRMRKIIPYLVIALICLFVLVKPFGSGDELWNYNFAKNVANGLAPYADFNIVQTPLSAYLAGFFLAIFGEGLIVHRIFGYILAVAIFCTAYHLCAKISKTPFISFISVLLLYAVHFPYFIYNYNYMSLWILLLILEIETENQEGTMGKQVTIGLLAGLTVLFKQSTGALLVGANFVCCLYNWKHTNQKKKALVFRVLASGIPMLLYIIYLLIHGSFAYFWEYAIAGISTFTHKITPIDVIKSGPGNIVFFVLIFFCYYLVLKNLIKKGLDRLLITMLIFNVCWTVVAYPLCDPSHLLCLLVPLIPAMLASTTCKVYKDWEKYVCITISVLVCTVAIVPLLALGSNFIISDLNHYQGVMMDSHIQERIESVGEYIQMKNNEGYHVRIASEAACAYKIPLDIYEKNWDMLLVGNIGSNDIQSLLQEENKTIYLVPRDSSVLNEQSYFELIDYIKVNYVKVEEVLNFDVYQAPNRIR